MRCLFPFWETKDTTLIVKSQITIRRIIFSHFLGERLQCYTYLSLNIRYNVDTLNLQEISRNSSAFLKTVICVNAVICSINKEENVINDPVINCIFYMPSKPHFCSADIQS